MERIYEYDSNWSVYRTDLTNSMQLILVESGSGVVAINEYWCNGSEYCQEEVLNAHVFNSMCKYLFSKVLRQINTTKSSGNYVSAYDNILCFQYAKKMLEERLNETTDSEEKDSIKEEIEENLLSIEECQEYLHTLERIENESKYF